MYIYANLVLLITKAKSAIFAFINLSYSIFYFIFHHATNFSKCKKCEVIVL